MTTLPEVFCPKSRKNLGPQFPSETTFYSKKFSGHVKGSFACFLLNSVKFSLGVRRRLFFLSSSKTVMLKLVSWHVRSGFGKHLRTFLSKVQNCFALCPKLVIRKTFSPKNKTILDFQNEIVGKLTEFFWQKSNYTSTKVREDFNTIFSLNIFFPQGAPRTRWFRQPCIQIFAGSPEMLHQVWKDFWKSFWSELFMLTLVLLTGEMQFWQPCLETLEKITKIFCTFPEKSSSTKNLKTIFFHSKLSSRRIECHFDNDAPRTSHRVQKLFHLRSKNIWKFYYFLKKKTILVQLCFSGHSKYSFDTPAEKSMRNCKNYLPKFGDQINKTNSVEKDVFPNRRSFFGHFPK